MQQQNSKIQSIQILRAAAALLVVFSHALGNWSTHFSLDTPNNLIHLPGKIGVYTFFVISGYIIWSNSQTTGFDSAKQFLLRRLIRIAPLYWVFTAAYATKLFIQGKAASWMDITKSILFIPYMNADGHMMPVHQLGWTLNYEMYFYLLVAFGLLWKVGPMLRALCLFTILASQIFLSQPFYGNSIVLFFMAGVVLKFLTERSSGTLQRNAPAERSSGTLQRNAPAERSSGTLQRNAPAERSSGTLQRNASWIGDASYSIYLVHPFILGALNAMLKRLEHPTAITAMVYFGVCLFLSTTAGALVYRWVEKPALAFMRRLLQV